MIEVQEALALIDQFTAESPEVSAEVDAGLNGAVLAQSISAPINLPEFRQSSMDGYALCGDASQGHELIGEIPAGSAKTYTLEPGQAVRIFTGAAVPDSADRVVMQEHVSVENNRVTLIKDPIPGANIRGIGSQIKQGQPVIDKGTKVTPAIIGMLLSLGFTQVVVRKPPRVCVLVTGDELTKPGVQKSPGQVYESNGSVLEAVVKEDGAYFVETTAVKDDFKASVRAIKSAVAQADLVLISGGISVGDYDFIAMALEELGAKKHFHGVRQKPGKPLYFGTLDGTAIFALPGNPASTLSCYCVYVRRWLQNYSGTRPVAVSMPLGADLVNRFGRALFIKAKFMQGRAMPIDEFNSATLLSFSKADILIFMGAEVTELKAGEMVETYKI
jgi:molybdopterin molybdotransferase